MKKILLCDDDSDITTLVGIIVKSMNYQFSSVNEVDEVCALVIKEKPDLVLMDLWIPKIGGEESVKRLKAHHDTRNINVLLFSANDQLHEIAQKVGADDFIRKPFDVNKFKEKVNEFMEE